MSGRLRAAVIGAGTIARQHLGALREVPEAEAVAVCDRSPAVAESVAERFEVGAWYTDHERLLEEVRPHVVHVTTPAASHAEIAQAALQAGAHVLVEKPITVDLGELDALLRCARRADRVLVESYSLVFGSQPLRMRELLDTGALGELVHVDVSFHLDVLAEGSRFADPNAPHPAVGLRGGIVGDFLPHLASLAHAFAGPHRSVCTTWSDRGASGRPEAEFRALVEGERATASLLFSGRAQPDGLWLQVAGTRMRARANLLEPHLLTERLRGGPRPLIPLVNGLELGVTEARGALRGLARRLRGGAGSYEGLWELVRRTYAAIATGTPPPVSLDTVERVNRLVADLVAAHRP
jgi:predicted dehydrogenase